MIMYIVAKLYIYIYIWQLWGTYVSVCLALSDAFLLKKGNLEAPTSCAGLQVGTKKLYLYKHRGSCKHIANMAPTANPGHMKLTPKFCDPDCKTFAGQWLIVCFLVRPKSGTRSWRRRKRVRRPRE